MADLNFIRIFLLILQVIKIINKLKLDRWVDLIIYTGNQTNLPISRIARNLDMTFSHCINIYKEMEKNDWIKSKKKGRNREIILTEKGTKIKAILEKLLQVL